MTITMSSTNSEEGSTRQCDESQLEPPLRPSGKDGTTVRVVSGRGYRYVRPFPYKLHEMLDEVEKAGSDAIVGWLPGGKAFRVHKPDPFIETIVPIYFKKQRKYKSFQRQLHLYGFQRIVAGHEKGAYYHKYFVREDRHLSHQMIPTRMNKAAKMVEQEAKQVQQTKPMRTPTEKSKPSPVAASASGCSSSCCIDYDPTLDMFNDSADYYERPEIGSSSVKIEPEACIPNSFQQTNNKQHQLQLLGPQEGATSMPNVMQMANCDQGQHSYRARYMQPLPMPQVSSSSNLVSNNSNLDFSEDVISLFGTKPRFPPFEISFTNHQFNQPEQPLNIDSQIQGEDYSELIQSICSCVGQDSFLTEAV